MNKRKGQGSFEYILLLAGVLTIVILTVVILRTGVINTANQQVAGSVGTLTQLTSGCQAVSSLVLDPNGANATLTICMLIDPNNTVVNLYSSPIVFTGSTDQPVNMSFSNVNGFTTIFLNVTGKNGTTLNMSQTHCVDAIVNGVNLLRQLCGTTGQTSGAATPTPTPTPTPSPQVVLNSPVNGGTIPNGTTFQYTPVSATTFSSATLYGNFTGVYAANVSNSSAVTNNSINSLVTTVPPGRYSWNVQVCDRFANCSFAPANFSFTAQYNATWTQTTQVDFAAGISVNVSLSAQPGNVTLNSSYSWMNVTPAISPNASYYGAMAFDTSRNLSVLFGGWTNSSVESTWTYNASNNTWVKVTPASPPDVRGGHAMVFDSSRNLTVLFGGWNNTYFSDIWVYNASANTWTNATPVSSPPARYGHGMAFDPSRNLTVLFGGNVLGALGNDTWVYNASANNWTNVTPSNSPSIREYPGMAFDSARNLTVLFGGLNSLYMGDTWVYNATSNTWTNVTPAISPSPRYGPEMVYDSVHGLDLLFGGLYGSALSDTWAYNASSNIWTQVFPTLAPASRYWSAFDFDSAKGAMVIFGGRGNVPYYYGDTWVYSPAYMPGGFLSSQVFDASQNASWFLLNWSQTLPTSTNVSLQTRTCTLAACADNPAYSAGLSCVGGICSQVIPSTSGRRYIQWQANLTTTNTSNTPVLSEVNATYGIPG